MQNNAKKRLVDIQNNGTLPSIKFHYFYRQMIILTINILLDFQKNSSSTSSTLTSLQSF